MNQIVLFKNTGVIVHRTLVSGEQSAGHAEAVLETGDLTIKLDAAATEVLVGYLQVIKAYLANSTRSRQQVLLIFKRVAENLRQQLKSTGRTTAEYADIKELIQQLGCLHDWATKGSDLLQERESHN